MNRMSFNDLISTGTTRSFLNSFSMEHTCQRAEGMSSSSSIQPFTGGSLSSSYFNRSSGPSAFHPFIPSSFTCKWPLLDRHYSNDGLMFSEDQRKNNYLTDSSESNSAFVLKSMSAAGRTGTLTTSKAVQSEIRAASHCGMQNNNKEGIRRKLSGANSDCSSSGSPDWGNKNTNLPTGKKAQKKEMPANVKDERYWQRRHRNNLAAKKSRDAKRRQELSTQQRVTFLKAENTQLILELSCLRQENAKLKNLLGV